VAGEVKMLFTAIQFQMGINAIAQTLSNNNLIEISSMRLLEPL